MARETRGMGYTVRHRVDGTLHRIVDIRYTADSHRIH